MTGNKKQKDKHMIRQNGENGEAKNLQHNFNWIIIILSISLYLQCSNGFFCSLFFFIYSLFTWTMSIHPEMVIELDSI